MGKQNGLSHSQRTALTITIQTDAGGAVAALLMNAGVQEVEDGPGARRSAVRAASYLSQSLPRTVSPS